MDLKRELIENDIRAIAAASKKKDDLDVFRRTLAKLVRKNIPRVYD